MNFNWKYVKLKRTNKNVYFRMNGRDKLEFVYFLKAFMTIHLSVQNTFQCFFRIFRT